MPIRFDSSSEEHPGLFEQLARGACAHSCFLAQATGYLDRGVGLVQLAAREGMIAAHELKLSTSLDPKHFRVVNVSQEDNRSGVFRCHSHRTAL